MKHLKLALTVAACSMAASAMATPSPASYSFLTNQTSSTGGVNTSNGTAWNNSAASYYGTGGSNYGNTYTWAAGASGGSTQVTLSAWGTTTSKSSNIAKGWLGDYGTPNGFGVTSQSLNELNGSHDPNASSPNYEHAIDNLNAYETLLLSFASAVTLNSISIGFKGADSDATVLEYTGIGDPTAALTTMTYAQLLANGWKIVGNLLDLSTSGINKLDATNANYSSVSSAVSSKYWMVGAYLQIGTNGAGDGITDTFKVNGITATQVPEPSSIALVGIAGAALGGSRIRRRRAA